MTFFGVADDAGSDPGGVFVVRVIPSEAHLTGRGDWIVGGNVFCGSMDASVLNAGGAGEEGGAEY